MMRANVAFMNDCPLAPKPHIPYLNQPPPRPQLFFLAQIFRTKAFPDDLLKLSSFMFALSTNILKDLFCLIKSPSLFFILSPVIIIRHHTPIHIMTEYFAQI
eukprot:GDKK01003175.1.p1 GENE.GDKK01003175.1~~GDKK01003175.1.p1  ORF type:complete len:102 (+),score=5.50 GDKK01003175.1:184-489(+)